MGLYQFFAYQHCSVKCLSTLRVADSIVTVLVTVACLFVFGKCACESVLSSVLLVFLRKHLHHG